MDPFQCVCCCRSMQKIIRMKLQEVMKMLFYLVLLPNFVWLQNIRVTTELPGQFNNFLKRLTLNEHWSRGVLCYISRGREKLERKHELETKKNAMVYFNIPIKLHIYIFKSCCQSKKFTQIIDQIMKRYAYSHKNLINLKKIYYLIEISPLP